MTSQRRRAGCHPHALGEHFVTSLFNTVGETAFSAALGELYDHSLRFQDFPSEERICQAFLGHAPPDREAALVDLYRRLHGGPLLDGE